MDKVFVDLDNDQMSFEETATPFQDEEVKDRAMQSKPMWREEDISPYDLMEAKEDMQTPVWKPQKREEHVRNETFDDVQERIRQFDKEHLWQDSDRSPYDFDSSLDSLLLNEDAFCKDCANYDQCTLRKQNTPKKAVKAAPTNEKPTANDHNEETKPKTTIVDAQIEEMEQALQNVDQTLAESDDFDCTYESDMYDNGNIDWQNGIDVSEGSSIVSDRRSSTDQPKTITYEKKTMVKENNKETITWIRMIREY